MNDDHEVDEAAPAPLVLRVVKGEPTPEDLAVLTALMAASGSGDAPSAGERRGGWTDPSRRVRAPLVPGPDGWRSYTR